MQEWKSLEVLINASLENYLDDLALDKILTSIRENTAFPFEEVDKQGNTPLHCLLKIYHNQLEAEFAKPITEINFFLQREKWFARIFDALIKKGVKIDHKNHKGDTALHFAIKVGSSLMVQQLVCSDALMKINTQEFINQRSGSRGDTALHIACRGHYEFNLSYHELLVSSVDALAKSKEMKTVVALEQELISNYTGIINLLCQKGSHINARNNYFDTPVHLAVGVFRNKIIIQHILDKGADINLVNDNRNTVLHCALDGQRNTFSLIEVLFKNRPMEMRILINLPNSQGIHPLHSLCGKEDYPDRHRTLLCLLNYPNIHLDPIDEELETPLYYAVQNNNAMEVQLLIDKGADINRKDRNGNTLLHLVITRYEEYTIQIAQLKTKDNLKQKIKDLELMILFLVKKGASIERLNNKHQSPKSLLSDVKLLKKVQDIADKMANAIDPSTEQFVLMARRSDEFIDKLYQDLSPYPPNGKSSNDYDIYYYYIHTYHPIKIALGLSDEAPPKTASVEATLFQKHQEMARREIQWAKNKKSEITKTILSVLMEDLEKKLYDPDSFKQTLHDWMEEYQRIRNHEQFYILLYRRILDYSNDEQTQLACRKIVRHRAYDWNLIQRNIEQERDVLRALQIYTQSLLSLTNAFYENFYMNSAPFDSSLISLKILIEDFRILLLSSTPEVLLEKDRKKDRQSALKLLQGQNRASFNAKMNNNVNSSPVTRTRASTQRDCQLRSSLTFFVQNSSGDLSPVPCHQSPTKSTSSNGYSLMPSIPTQKSNSGICEEISSNLSAHTAVVSNLYRLWKLIKQGEIEDSIRLNFIRISFPNLLAQEVHEELLKQGFENYFTISELKELGPPDVNNNAKPRYVIELSIEEYDLLQLAEKCHSTLSNGMEDDEAMKDEDEIQDYKPLLPS